MSAILAAKMENFSSFTYMGLGAWAVHLVAVWLLGLALGWLLPRPKWSKRKSAFMLSPRGVWIARFSVVWNAFLIIREVWYRFCQPGTFRSILRAAWVSVTTRQPFQWPSMLTNNASNAAGASGNSTALADNLRWYVTTADLQTFKDTIEGDCGPAWEKMLHKEWEGCIYTAYRRSLPSGRTEYKSVTLSEDATAQEFMDFYLDDDVRPKWDGMITEHQLLESAHDQSHRCQVVRWLRSFPFAFLSRREYVIARRVFPGDDSSTLYGITKSVEHPAAPPMQGVVRMSTYYSMWRSRTVPCPKGSDRPMCETTLLHFEDFGIPENLARFAVKHGMAGFVSKMVPHVKEFVAERRTRVGPYKADSKAYGANLTPLMRSGSISLPSTPGTPTAADQEATPSTASRMLRSSSVRGFGYVILASGVALALSRTGSSPVLADDESAATKAEHHPSLPHHRHLHRKRHHGHGHGHHGVRHHAALKGHHSHGHHSKHRSAHALGGLRSHRVSHAETEA